MTLQETTLTIIAVGEVSEQTLRLTMSSAACDGTLDRFAVLLSEKKFVANCSSRFFCYSRYAHKHLILLIIREVEFICVKFRLKLS